MNYRGKRFLIDKIDSKLGSLDKELKFDKMLIYIGIGIIIFFAFIILLIINKYPVLALFCALIIMFGIFLSYTMIKEYLSDLRKAKKQQ